MKQLLYSGSIMQYDDFIHRFELSPAVVKYVDSLEDLHGYKDITLVYAPGFQMVLEDTLVSSYCRTHGIGMIQEQDFLENYIGGYYNE